MVWGKGDSVISFNFHFRHQQENLQLESEDSWDTDQIPQVTSYHRLDLTPGRVVLVDAVTEFEKFLDNMQVRKI